MVRLYETIFILKPELPEETRTELQDRIKKIITDNDGEIVEVEDWGNKKLAYEINKIKNGYYTLITFKGQPNTLNELERNYKIIDDVLRYLIVKKED